MQSGAEVLALAGWKLFWPAGVAKDVGPAPERIDLWPDQAPMGDGRFVPTNAFLSVYQPATANGTALMICPGSAYSALVFELEGKTSHGN